MRRLSIILLLSTIAAACGGGPKDPEEALKDKGLLGVLQDASDDWFGGFGVSYRFPE